MVSMFSIVVCLISTIHLVTSDCVSVANKNNNNNINPKCAKAEYQPYTGKVACEKAGCTWKPSAQNRIPPQQGQFNLIQSKSKPLQTEIAKQSKPPPPVLINSNQKEKKKVAIHSKANAKTKQENKWKQLLNNRFQFNFGPQRHIFAHDHPDIPQEGMIRSYVLTLYHATTASAAKAMMATFADNKANPKQGIDPGLNILDPKRGSALIFGKGVYFAGGCIPAQAKTFGKRDYITHCIKAEVYVGEMLQITEETPLRYKAYDFKTLQRDGYDSVYAKMTHKYGGSMPASGSELGGIKAGFDPKKKYDSQRLLGKAEGYEFVIYNKDQAIIKSIDKIEGGYFNAKLVKKYYAKKKTVFSSAPAFNDYFVNYFFTLIFLAFSGVIGCCCCFIAGLFGGYFAAIGVNDATKYFISK